MKRTIMIAIAAVVCMGACAKKKIGELVNVNGVAAFVFYVDSSGEHGLMMAFPALTSYDMERVNKQMGKMVKKGQFSAEMMSTAKESLGDMKKLIVSPDILDREIKEDIFKDLVGRLSDKGKENAKVIEEYCVEKSLDMKHFFPWEHYAKELGEGWFIPGDRELTLFAEFYTGGVGKKFSLSNTKFLLHGRDLSDNIQVQGILTGIVQHGLMSSTAIFPKYGFRTLQHISNATKGYFELLDNLDGGVKETSGVKTCAVREF